MIIAILIVLGLCFGSFVNAYVSRLHEQEVCREQIDELKNASQTKASKQKIAALRRKIKELSINNGRSKCVSCKHALAWYDLLPVISWLSLGGKCRYCRSTIVDTPLAELLTPALMVISYLCWPTPLHGQRLFDLVVWLIAVVIFVALSLYDFRWMILPNRLVYSLIGLALFQRVVDSLFFAVGTRTLAASLLAALIGGGIFYVLYQVSDGKWIGGGDVKLGVGLGLLVGDPLQALLLLMIASFIGIVLAIPTIFRTKLKKNLQIPFGPSLMLACYILVLDGSNIVNWYLGLLQP